MNRWRWILGLAMMGLVGVWGAKAGPYFSEPQHVQTESVLEATPDPVSAGDGAFYFAMPLLNLGGPMNLGFTLHHNSSGGKVNWDVWDLPGDGRWWWDPLATLSVISWVSPTGWQFQVEGGQAVGFVENPDGSLRLAEEGDYGLANSPIAFQAQQTNGWTYLLDPHSGRVKMFENFTNTSWRIAAQVDRNGNALMYTYEDPPSDFGMRHLPIRIEDNGGRWMELEYPPVGFNNYIGKVTDHAGREVRFEYEGTYYDKLAHVVEVMGGTNRFTFAPSSPSLVEAHRRPRGNTPWVQQYGHFKLYADDEVASAAVTNQTDAYGNAITLSYDTNAHTVAVTWQNGETTHFTHTGRYLPPEQSRDPAGGQTLYAVNENQQITAVTDRSGGETGFGFDPETRETTAITNPSGDTLTFAYHTTTQAVVNPITLEAVEFVFHDLAARHYPDGTSEAYDYDGAGNMTARVDRAGGRWSYDYDAHGNLLRRADSAGSETRFTYTTNGLMESATLAGGGTNVFAYDDLSRLTSITYPDDTFQQYAYDLAGRVTAVSNSLGETWSYAYDANGNLTNAVGPTGAEATYAYDLMDRLVTNAPSYAEATSYEYDVMGEVVRTVQGGILTEFQRDALGNVTNTQRGGGAAHGHVRRERTARDRCAGGLRQLRDPARRAGAGDGPGGGDGVCDAALARCQRGSDAGGRFAGADNGVDLERRAAGNRGDAVDRSGSAQLCQRPAGHLYRPGRRHMGLWLHAGRPPGCRDQSAGRCPSVGIQRHGAGGARHSGKRHDVGIWLRCERRPHRHHHAGQFDLAHGAQPPRPAAADYQPGGRRGNPHLYGGWPAGHHDRLGRGRGQ